MNKVKIIATIGPNVCNKESLRALSEAGMDVVRLNGAHADLDWHHNAIQLIRDHIGHVPVLLDIPGRKIRTSKLACDIPFRKDDTIILTSDSDYKGTDKIPVTHSGLHEVIKEKTIVYMDDGTLRFLVLSITGTDIVCRAMDTGIIKSGKGVQIAGGNSYGEFLSARDHALIEFAKIEKVDFVGISFVDNPDQVREIRKLLGKNGPRIISKIETQGAIDYLDQVIECSDAIMVDRGDLSVETNLEKIVLSQKKILKSAYRQACPVIIATEMLSSMIDHPIPKKAEISDITNAVLDGATALMLSGETAVGQYPVETVTFMRRVIDTACAHQDEEVQQLQRDRVDSVPEVMGEAIGLICRQFNVTKIIAITKSGYAARMIAPKGLAQPILAVSNDMQNVRSFNLMRGTKGIFVDVPYTKTSTEHIPVCLEKLWQRTEICDEDVILVTAVTYPRSGNRMNLIETHKVSDLRETLKWTKT